MAQSGAPVIAIDLGTAYTRVGFFDGEKPIIFPDEQGRTDIPSYVAFTNTGVLVGEKALDHAGKDPANTVFDIIRLLGRQFSDPTLQADMQLWPFNVVQGQDNKAVVLVQSKGTQCQFSPEEICSLILLRMKQIAEFRLGYADVISVVITVPVNFNHFQRQAIKDAASIARLNVEGLISAPAAAAMLYNYNLDWSPRNFSVKTVWNRFTGGPEHNLLVFDLGAGTLDVSVVSIMDGKCQVRGTSGDDHLGGEDFDKILTNYLIANVLTYKQKKYINNSKMAVRRLRQACEKAKVVLSETVNCKLNISSLHEDECIRTTISDDMFKKVTEELLGKCIETMIDCIKEVGIDKRAITTVITVGGAAKIPRLQQCISRFFSNKDLFIENNYEGAVIRGAAIHAFLLSGKKSDRVQSISLIDTSTFSFGIPLANGKMGVMIQKNTVLPTVNKILFHYTHYHQNLAIEVYEGKGYFTRQNTLIYKLQIPGYSSRSECDYDVLFDMDASGILTVKAVDTSCGTENSVIIGNINHSLPTLEYSRKRVWDTFYSQEEVNMPNNLNIASSGVEPYNPNNKKKETAKEIAQGSKQSTKLVEPAIGIDLGTTCSCVGVWMRGRVEIIPNEYGSRTSLSCVAFPETGRLIGDAAKQQLTMNPANTIINVKHLIGRHKLDQNLQNYIETLPFKVKEDPNGRPAIVVQYNGEEKLFAPEEITAMMLRRIKEQAKDHTKIEVKDAVITVPSSFNDSQRKATRDAGLIAGLNILQLLNEPTAAAITYYLHKSSLESFDTKNILVFDLGGGTFDVSVITVSNGKIQVIAVNGDSNLGGEDFDTILVNHFVKQFDSINLSEGKSVSKNPRSLRRLRAACEKAKRVLSTVPKTNIDLDSLYNGTDFSVSITKLEFEALSADLISRCMGHVKRCLEDAKMDKSNISDVVLVGGSTRIPLLQQTLQKLFDGKELCKSINQDEAVAYGAAVLAAKLGQKDDNKFHGLEIQEVTSLSFGTENVGGGMHWWLPKYSNIPMHKNWVVTTTEDNMSEIPLTLFEQGVSGKKSFVLSGIPPHSRGSTEMCVDLMIDSSGILNLSYNKVASQSSEIVVKELGSPNLIEKDIEEMTNNAVKFNADDDEQKQRAEAMNSMENIALSKLKEVASSAIEDSKKKAIEDETNKLLNWLDTHHNAKIEEINTKKQQWESLFQ